MKNEELLRWLRLETEHGYVKETREKGWCAGSEDWAHLLIEVKHVERNNPAV